MRDVQCGWIIRFVHANGASFFFMFLYAHIGRSLYFGSYLNRAGWNIGVVLLFMSMAIAFTGYVLPWGQMSYWGATVIINMFSVIPFFGQSIVEWIMGGYVVCDATLKRFFVFHFLLPLIMVLMVALHLVYLHEGGANNPLGVSTCTVPFHPYYTWKDLWGVSVAWFFFSVVCFYFPYLFMDPVNLTPMDSMKTPPHIQPEWYFLFAYSGTSCCSSSGSRGITCSSIMSVIGFVLFTFFTCWKLLSIKILSYLPVIVLMFCLCFYFSNLGWKNSCSGAIYFCWSGFYCDLFWLFCFNSFDYICWSSIYVWLWKCLLFELVLIFSFFSVWEEKSFWWISLQGLICTTLIWLLPISLMLFFF
uniref:Cytochrome b n=1 Tax=Anadara kagoshimensis TaxID=1390362 RepID=A0A096XAC7_9BIVA|nr:cytochrome b [Anadara kagoshimensis]